MTEEATTKKRRGRKAKNPLSNKASWTAKELQMWISVASSIHGGDFMPDEEQWDFIRDAIFKLQTEPRVRQQPMHHMQPMHPGMAMGPQQPLDPNTGMPALLQAQDPLPPAANLSLAELQARSAAGGIPTGRDPVTGDKVADTGGFA